MTNLNNSQETKNTYKKYCANVFVAKCPEQHEKGETIILTTKYGKENECIVFNLVGKTSDGFYLYSIVRADGFNNQERAKKKAEKLNGYTSNAEKRSTEAYDTRATKSELDFLSLGEPIKIGHHSERRHRKLFEKYDRKMRKSIEETEKAEEYRRRAEYWAERANKINLSMPESLDFFEHKLEEAKKHHKDLKENPHKREHSYSLTYANKEVKELTKKVETAIKLWGTVEEVEQLNKEKKEEAEKNRTKSSKFSNWRQENGGFFFFGSNVEAFKKEHKKLIDNGYLEEGEKVTHVGAGLYIPKKHLDSFLSTRF